MAAKSCGVRSLLSRKKPPYARLPRADPDRSGAEYLYGLNIQVLGQGQIYALEDPSYQKIEQVYRANGISIDKLRMGKSGIETSELIRTRARVLHVTPFNSYPSGITATASKRAEYLRFARERHA